MVRASCDWIGVDNTDGTEEEGVDGDVPGDEYKVARVRASAANWADSASARRLISSGVSPLRRLVPNRTMALSRPGSVLSRKPFRFTSVG